MRKEEVRQAILVLRTEVNAIRNVAAPGTGLLDDSTPPPNRLTKAQLVNEANDLIDEILAAGRPAPYRKVRVPGAIPHDDIEVVGAASAAPAPAPATPGVAPPVTPAPATPATGTPAPATPATPATPAPPPAPPATPATPATVHLTGGHWVAWWGLLLVAVVLLIVGGLGYHYATKIIRNIVSASAPATPAPAEETTAAPAPAPKPLFDRKAWEEFDRFCESVDQRHKPLPEGRNVFSARDIEFAGDGGMTISVMPKEYYNRPKSDPNLGKLNRRVRMLELESARQERMHQHIDTE